MSSAPTSGPRPGETNAAYRERLYREVRARLEQGESPPPPTPAPPAADPDLVALHAAATARAPAIDAREARNSGAAYFRQDVGRSAASALPPIARAASGQRIEHLRIHEADLRPVARATPAARWRALVRKSYEDRPIERGLHFGTRAVAHFVHAILYVESVMEKGLGYVRRTFDELGKIGETKYSGRHMKRVQRDLESRGLIDVLNTLKRDGDMWVRGANLYVPNVDEDAPPLPADVDAPDAPVLATASAGISAGARLSALFGLALRPWGLNTTPLRSPQDNPAPA